jgi:hypothetical protein
MRKKPSRYGSGGGLPGPLKALTATTIAGQPLALWILLAAGLLAVIVLAAIIFVRAAG